MEERIAKRQFVSETVKAVQQQRAVLVPGQIIRVLQPIPNEPEQPQGKRAVDLVDVHGLRPRQCAQRFLAPPGLLAADGQLVQRHQGGLLLPGKPGVGLFIASGFDPRRRGVVANRPQGAFVLQILRQPPPHPIVALHVGQILPVAIGVAEKELRFQHEPHRALPAGKVVGGLQGVHGGGIAARVVVGNAQHQVGVCVGHESNGFGLLPL